MYGELVKLVFLFKRNLVSVMLLMLVVVINGLLSGVLCLISFCVIVICVFEGWFLVLRMIVCRSVGWL